MTLEMGLTLAVVMGVLCALIGTRATPDFILVVGLVVLLLTGVLSPSGALAGFSNEGLITVGVLFVVVAGLRETGGVTWIVHRVLGRPRNLTGAQLRLMLPAISLSAFLNNTPVVGMFIPAVKDWAKQHQLSVSKLLIPLSYASILGGTCTLIGTSTNLVVNGYVVSHTDLPSLRMFEIAWVGIPCAIIGLLYVLVFSRWLLPERLSAMRVMDDPREYTVEMLVEPGSPLAGETIEEAGLRSLPGLYIIEIERDGQILPAVGPQQILLGGDRLVFTGIVESVVDLQKIRGLKPATDQVFKLDSPRANRVLIETVVSNSCPLEGKTIRDGRFRSRYNAVVIAVARNGERLRMKIGDIILRPGDTLLLEAEPSFVEQQRNSRDFFLVSQVENSQPPRHDRGWVAIGILAGMVALFASGVTDIVTAAMLAASLMILSGCCSISAARTNVDLQVLIAIGAAFGIGRAMSESGLAELIAFNCIALAQNDPLLTLALVYLLTSFFTEIMTNNAAAILIIPIALDASALLGVNPIPFAIVVMMAASASFATPIGYQTNLMVYGPGGYRFTDYLRFGAPLNILMFMTTVTIAPLVWAF